MALHITPGLPREQRDHEHTQKHPDLQAEACTLTCFIYSVHCSCVHHGTGSNIRGAGMAKSGLGLLLSKGWGGSHRDGNGSLCTFDTLTSVCPSFLYIPRNNLSTSLNSNLHLLWTPNLLPHEVQCPGSTHMTHTVLVWDSRTLAPSCQRIRSQTSCPG